MVMVICLVFQTGSLQIINNNNNNIGFNMSFHLACLLLTLLNSKGQGQAFFKLHISQAVTLPIYHWHQRRSHILAFDWHINM